MSFTSTSTSTGTITTTSIASTTTSTSTTTSASSTSFTLSLTATSHSNMNAFRWAMSGLSISPKVLEHSCDIAWICLNSPKIIPKTWICWVVFRMNILFDLFFSAYTDHYCRYLMTFECQKTAVKKVAGYVTGRLIATWLDWTSTGQTFSSTSTGTSMTRSVSTTCFDREKDRWEIFWKCGRKPWSWLVNRGPHGSGTSMRNKALIAGLIKGTTIGFITPY